jgi:hypothetical protein
MPIVLPTKQRVFSVVFIPTHDDSPAHSSADHWDKHTCSIFLWQHPLTYESHSAQRHKLIGHSLSYHCHRPVIMPWHSLTQNVVMRLARHEPHLGRGPPRSPIRIGKT